MTEKPGSIPNALAIAGSDPSGGAGVQADLKTFSALGVYGMAVLTALTAQNTRGVSAVHVPPPGFTAAQIAAVAEDIRVDAVKIGMIATADVGEAVAEAIRAAGIGPVVLDPVMVAKGGHRLLDMAAVSVLREKLIPLAAIITPNIEEAAALLDLPPAASRGAMAEQAERLLAQGPGAVLLKGGHLTGDGSPDLLLTRSESVWLEARRTRTTSTHGTGCTLSAAIAARLAHGDDLVQAARAAKAYVTAAIAASGRLTVGLGHGPTHHFHAFWS